LSQRAVIDQELWEAAQDMRERRAATRRDTIPGGARVYSLSSLGVCGDCGAALHVESARGRPRLYCYGRRQGGACSSHSVPLSILEEEIGAFLRTFTIPDDYQKRLHAFVSNERQVVVDVTDQRNKLEAHLGRLKDLYLLGDITRAHYLAQCEQGKRDLAVLDAQDSGRTTRLQGLAELLADASRAWQIAEPTQRNKLAKLLFEEVVVHSERGAAVKPRPELAGFFVLDHATRYQVSHWCGTGGPDGTHPLCKRAG
jgi:hypothetical protein